MPIVRTFAYILLTMLCGSKEEEYRMFAMLKIMFIRGEQDMGD